MTKTCEEKVVKSEAEGEDFNKRVSDMILDTASTFQSTPGASIPSSRENSLQSTDCTKAYCKR